MLHSIQGEILKKAKKIRAYLNQSNCDFAVWEVKEASHHLWPHLSDAFLKRIEEKVTDLDSEYYKKKHGKSYYLDSLSNFPDL